MNGYRASCILRGRSAIRWNHCVCEGSRLALYQPRIKIADQDRGSRSRIQNISKTACTAQEPL